MAYGALGQHDRARAMLQEVAGKLVEKLGQDNPITHVSQPGVRLVMDW